MQVAGTLPRTPIAVLAITVESLLSSMTEATLAEEGEWITYSVESLCSASTENSHVYYKS